MSVGIDELGMTCGDVVDPCTEERRQEGKEGKEGGTGSIVVRVNCREVGNLCIVKSRNSQQCDALAGADVLTSKL
jgi:hypothetical protein